MAIKFPSLLFTPGRDCAGPTAVVLHEYKSGIEMLDKEMDRCLRPRPLCSPGCHTSFHYGIGACHLHQYIDTDDTAWGFYYIPTPTCPVPPCPIDQICDGVGADQYNPDFDGNPATPDVEASETCLDANCSVIHVAVITGTASVSDGIFCIGAPTFNESAYRCLVQSLCEIFEDAGLLPVSGTTLLTHIGELVNVDVDQLEIDILACINAPIPPLPPCNCEVPQTPITVVDTATIDLTASGTDNHTLSGTVRVSATPGNSISVNGDGLFVAASPGETPITPVDTNSINLTASGVSNHTIQADAIISPNANNQVSILGNGLFGAETSLVATDSSTIDFTTSGFAGHNLTGDVIISEVEGNQLINLAGLFVPPPTALASCNGTVLETDRVVTVEAFVDAVATESTDGIWSTNSDNPCPARLIGIACTGSLPILPVVLGTDGTASAPPVWGRVQRPTLNVVNFTNALSNIGPDSGDIFNYLTNSDHTVNLIAPSSVCSKTDFWVKNSSNNDLTLDGVASSIDGAATITLQGVVVGGYPFGTNGGESVHLAWNGFDWIII